MLPAYWPVCKFDLILPVLFLAAFLTYWPPSLLLLAPVSMCTYCLPNPRSFCQIHCSLSCAVLPCALVKYLFNRMAYDEKKKIICLKQLRCVIWKIPNDWKQVVVPRPDVAQFEGNKEDKAFLRRCKSLVFISKNCGNIFCFCSGIYLLNLPSVFWILLLLEKQLT